MIKDFNEGNVLMNLGANFLDSKPKWIGIFSRSNDDGVQTPV